MYRKLLKTLPFVLVLVATSGFSVYKAEQGAKQPYDQGHIVAQDQMMCAYNAPARIDVTGAWDFFITGKFIYWQPREKGLDIAVPTAGVSGERVLNMEFEYQPGFKVGLGMNFDHDNWDLFAEYTWLCMSESHSSNAPSTVNFTSTWLHTAQTAVTHAKGTWKLDTHIVDLMLGRPYYVGTKLTFRPHVGARAYFLYQKYNLEYTVSSTIYHSDNKSSSWAVGPRVGIDTNWLLGAGFRFYGNTAASLAYQQFYGVRTYQWHASTTDRDVKDKIGYVTPNFEIGMGFGWGSYFADNSWHFDLLLGYEFHYFWNQNIMRNLKDKESNQIDGDAGDLMYHGLTVGIRFDF